MSAVSARRWPSGDELGEERSFVAPGGFAFDTFTLLSTASAVWDEDNVRNGVMFGDRLLYGATARRDSRNHAS